MGVIVAVRLIRKAFAAYALAAFVILSSPTWAFAGIYNVSGLSGLGCSVGTYFQDGIWQKSVNMQWQADLVQLAVPVKGEAIQVLRSPAGTGNFMVVATLPVPDQGGNAAMSYSDIIGNGQYDYKVKSNKGLETVESNTVTVSVSGSESGGDSTGQNTGSSQDTGQSSNDNGAGQGNSQDGGNSQSNDSSNQSSGQNTGFHPSIYTDNQWRVIMFWYITLTALGGAFLLFAVLRSGYGYMAGAMNPGVRASFLEDVQRMVVAVGIVALAPGFVFILCLVNDQLVNLFASVLDSFVESAKMEQPNLGSMTVGMFEKILAAPFNAAINIFNWIFGTKSIDDLVFNGQTGSLFHGLFTSLDAKNNPVAEVVLHGAITAFTVYFNAIYAIRRWLLAINLVATPIIAWVWAISAERQIIEIWVAEVIQTIFMQASQALAFGVLFSILLYTGGTLSPNSTDYVVNQLITLGIFIGGFAGSIGMFLLTFNGLKLVLSGGGDDGKKRSEAIQGIGKVVIGMAIVGLAMVVAGFLAWLFSGDWGIRI